MSSSSARTSQTSQTSTKPSEARPNGPQPTASNGLVTTGLNVVLPGENASEIEKRFQAFREELQPSGEVGEMLVRRALIQAVRLDRSVAHETAALAERVRKAEADFVAPAGLDPKAIEQLKAEAKARALFDPSPEATLARRQEAAVERSFYRALKELRQIQQSAQAAYPGPTAESFRESLGSFFDYEKEGDELEAKYLEPHERTNFDPNYYLAKAGLPPMASRVDVPMTIGRRR